MILLRSSDRYGEYAEIDTATGEIVWYPGQSGAVVGLGHIDGHIAVIDGYAVCLYRERGRLHLRIGAVDSEITDDTSAELAQGKVSVLTLSRHAVGCFRWMYKRPVVEPPLDIDPTPFVEEEDFDFGLFVRNVMANPERRQRIYRHPSVAHTLETTPDEGHSE